MSVIIGLLAFVVVVLLIAYFISRTELYGLPYRRSRPKNYYEKKRRKEAFRAASKSLKLDMMQMDAFRQMEKEARKRGR